MRPRPNIYNSPPTKTQSNSNLQLNKEPSQPKRRQGLTKDATSVPSFGRHTDNLHISCPNHLKQHSLQNSVPSSTHTLCTIDRSHCLH